ncbi:alpha/beta hydrolase [Dactylosporangium sp. McL0621]|uniref:alpha/beta hydrolase n=1 Tax=Dactylosporangium sp. McL0621 TaxID=3415678 RepID=UPI003CE9FD3A
MRFTTKASSNGVVEREFTLGDITGVQWSPETSTNRAPLVLMGHGGGLHKKTPGLVARAQEAVTSWGFIVVAIDAPGHGDRVRTGEDEQARGDLRQAATAGDTERFASVSMRYMDSLAERAVPEWRAVLDAFQELPEIGADAPIGYGGGMSLGSAIGVPLAAAEPRIAAAVFGGGFFVSEAVLEAARRITVPIQFLLPLDEENVDRGSVLALFDAFASKDKTLLANPGTHRAMRWVGVDKEFLTRQLSQTGASPV